MQKLIELRRVDAAHGLVTVAADELDWDDEVRLALEERASLSPDALTGLEANLRFNGAETLHTKIFARLSAWQNWVFSRPNATGADGALAGQGELTMKKLKTTGAAPAAPAPMAMPEIHCTVARRSGSCAKANTISAPAAHSRVKPASRSRCPMGCAMI